MLAFFALLPGNEMEAERGGPLLLARPDLERERLIPCDVASMGPMKEAARTKE